jgi:hypothetical protein
MRLQQTPNGTRPARVPHLASRYRKLFRASAPPSTMKSISPLLFGAVLFVQGAAPALAQPATDYQQPIYRCADGKGSYTYTHVPCANARVIGAAPVSKAAASRQPVPQDRARLAARAQLSAEDQEQCSALETQMAEQQALQKARADKGEKLTEAEEGVLVRQRLKYREMKC